jgi:hypothetical protein
MGNSPPETAQTYRPRTEHSPNTVNIPLTLLP